MAQMSLEETVGIIREVIAVLAQQEEATTIAEIQKSHADLVKIAEKRVAEARKVSKELGTKVAVQEHETARLREEPVTLQAKKENVERQSELLVSALQQMERQQGQVNESLEAAQRWNDEIKARTREIDELKSDALPHLRMYHVISNLKWDYDSPALRGYVNIVDSKSGKVTDVQWFDIPAAGTQEAKFLATNKLWDLVDAATV